MGQFRKFDLDPLQWYQIGEAQPMVEEPVVIAKRLAPEELDFEIAVMRWDSEELVHYWDVPNKQQFALKDYPWWKKLLPTPF